MNIDEQIDELLNDLEQEDTQEKKKYDEVIIGLNDKGYESLSVNMSKILALVKQQELIIGAYKKYHGEQKEAIKNKGCTRIEKKECNRLNRRFNKKK